MAFDLSTAKPAQAAGKFDMSTAKPVEPAEEKQERMPGIVAAPLEAMAGFNRAVTGLVDFLGPDQANAVLQLAGSDYRVPTLTQALASATQGGYMEPGLGRDIAASAGEVAASGLAAGQALRAAARTLPQVASGGESVGAGVLRQMASATPAQDLAGGAVAGAGQAIGEEVGGPVGGPVGGMAGAMAAPAAVFGLSAAGAEGARRIFRGGAPREQFAATVDDFMLASGRTPTVAQASGNKRLQAVETRSSQFVGGAPVQRARQEVEQGIQNRLRGIAQDVSPVAGVERAGRTIQRGIIGPGGFVDRFRAQSGQLWNRVDDAIGENAEIAIENTRGRLGEMVRTDRFAQVLNNPQLTRMAQALEDFDRVDYRTLRQLRSAVGERLESNDLISDIPRAQLRRLYGAISEDIREAARGAGGEVINAFNRANNYTRSGHARLDDFVERIATKADLDKIFNAVTRGGEGTGVINAFKRSLRPDEWEVVASNVIRRMGRATPGRQDDTGEVFSVAKFLTDWNRLGPEGRRALFSGSERLSTYGRDLDRIAAVASRAKDSAISGANPSGTAQSLIGAALPFGAGTAVTGNPQFLLGVLGLMAGNAATARLMTSPNFVRWLAQGTTISPNATPAHLAKLASVAGASDLETAQAISGLLDQVGAQSEEAQ